MKKLILKTTTVKILENNDAQLQVVAGGAPRYPFPRQRSAPPFLCVPGGEGGAQ